MIKRSTSIFFRQLIRPSTCLRQRRCFCEASSASQSAQGMANQQQSSDTELSKMKLSLLKMDRTVADRLPKFFKTEVLTKDLFTSDVQYEDKVRGYNIRGFLQFYLHVIKMKLYFCLKSQYNTIKYMGSSVCDDLDYLSVFYRLDTFPFKLISLSLPMQERWTRNKQIIEGALDLHLNSDGHICKIVNRELTKNERLIIEHTTNMERAEVERQTQQKKQEAIKEEENDLPQKAIERKSKFQKYM